MSRRYKHNQGKFENQIEENKKDFVALMSKYTKEELLARAKERL